MRARIHSWRFLATAGGFGIVAAALFLVASARADFPWFGSRHHRVCDSCGDCPPDLEFEGTWYWLRSPEQERRVVVGLYNRYCVRCHGVDGRGVWDMPDVPNFANAAWQASRSDGQRARIILEGRGAVMPAFRGTLTLEEACAMARYLRTFVPGTEMSRPDFSEPRDQNGKLPMPKKAK